MMRISKVISEVTIGIGVLFIYCLISISIPVLLLNFIFRSLVWLLAKVFRPDLDCFVTAEHAVVAGPGPISNNANQNIVVCFTLEGYLTLKEIRASMQTQIFDLDKGRKFAYQNLKRTWTSFLGWAFWKTDKDFDLKYHIKDYDYTGHLIIANPYSENDVRAVLGGLLKAPWDRRRSPWELLKIPNGPGATSTTLIFRGDHILSDGYSLLGLLRTISQSDFTVPKIKLAQRTFSNWEKIGLAFKIPYDTIKNSLLAVGAPRLVQHANDTEMVSISPTVDVRVFSLIKTHFKISYGAVVYAVVLGAVERALVTSGLDVPENLLMTVVLPKPNHPGGMSIHAGVLLAKMPIRCESPVERLLRVQSAVMELSQSTALIGQKYMSIAAGWLPMILRRIPVKYSPPLSCSICVTNFPVVTSSDHYNGCQFQELIMLTSTLPQVALMAAAGGVNSKQGFYFSVSTTAFSKETIQNLGFYAAQETQALVDATI